MRTAVEPQSGGVLNLLETHRSVRVMPSGARRVLAAAGINQLGSVMQGFLVVFLVQAGFAPREAAVAAGAFAVGTLVGAPVGADLTTRWGPRTAMTAALTATGAFVALTPWAAETASPVAVTALALLTGVTTQAFRPPSSEALSRSVPAADAVVAFSAFRVSMNAGALLAPVIAAAAIARGWWTALFVLDALSCLVAAALVAGARLPTVDVGATASPSFSDNNLARQGPRALFTPTLSLYLVAMLTSGIVYCQTYSVLPLQLADAGQPTSLYAAVLSIGAITLVVLELPVTSATRHWPVPTAVFVGTLVFGLSYAAYAAAGVGAVVVAGAVLCVAGTTISAPRLWSHPSAAHPTLRPALFAASQAAFGLGMAIGPVLGVAVWQEVGRSWWAVIAVVGVISAVTGGFGTRTMRGAT